MNRPLDASRTAAILTAVEELLIEKGYENFGIRDVASRASTSLATLYRRWPTKHQMVAAALDASRSQPLPEIADPRHALDAFLMSRAEFFAANGGHLSGLIVAASEDADLAKAVAANLKRNIERPLVALVMDCPGRSQRSAKAYAQLVTGQLVYRAVILTDPFEPRPFVDELLEVFDDLQPDRE